MLKESILDSHPVYRARALGGRSFTLSLLSAFLSATMDPMSLAKELSARASILMI